MISLNSMLTKLATIQFLGSKTTGYSSTAQSAINRHPTASKDHQDLYAAFIDSQASAEGGSGNWELLDGLWIFCANQTDSLIDLKNGKVATNEGATYTSNGYSTNGSSSYVDTNFNPSSDGVNYAQDDAIAGAWVYDDSKSGSFVSIFGALSNSAGRRCVVFWNNAAQDWQAAINSTQLTNFSESNFSASKKLVSGLRTSSSTASLYQDSTLQESESETSVGLPNATITIGAQNNDGTIQNYFNGTTAVFYIGGGDGFDIDDFDSNLDTLLTGLGVSTS